MTTSERFRTTARLAALAAVAGILALPVAAAEPSPKPEYRIGIADRLEVFILEEDSREECLVRPDGKITLPLIGDLMALDRTPEQVARQIREALSEYHTDPTVSVTVREINSYKIYVLGKVASQTAVESVAPLRLLQVLAIAGGPTEFANGKVVVLREGEQGGQERRKIDYDDILDGDAPEDNIWLFANDVVVVQ
jgi:polysaccharide export outer membrane protein